MASIIDDYFTEPEAAAEIRCTPRTVSRYRKQPDGLPYIKLGGRILIRRSTFKEWIEGRERRPNPRRRGEA